MIENVPILPLSICRRRRRCAVKTTQFVQILFLCKLNISKNKFISRTCFRYSLVCCDAPVTWVCYLGGPHVSSVSSSPQSEVCLAFWPALRKCDCNTDDFIIVVLRFNGEVDFIANCVSDAMGWP